MGLGKTRASVDDQRHPKQALGPYFTNRRKVVESGGEMEKLGGQP